MIRGLRAIVVSIAVLALAGCVGGSGYSDLEGPATAEDRLPAAVSTTPGDGLDVGSVRYVGEHDGVSFYLGSGKPSGVCLVVHRSAEAWLIGCGAAGVLTVSGAGVTATVVPDAAPVPENGIRIGNNIVLED